MQLGIDSAFAYNVGTENQHHLITLQHALWTQIVSVIPLLWRSYLGRGFRHQPHLRKIQLTRVLCVTVSVRSGPRFRPISSNPDETGVKSIPSTSSSVLRGPKLSRTCVCHKRIRVLTDKRPTTKFPHWTLNCPRETTISYLKSRRPMPAYRSVQQSKTNKSWGQS